MNLEPASKSETEPTLVVPDRWTLIRDMGVLQVKLIVDGLRDFLLVPVSIATGIVSLLKGGERPGPEFYELLRYGRRTERLINLFGAAERVYGPAEEETLPDIDQMVAKVETFVVDEYKSGGITAQAKEQIDKMLDTMRTMANNQGRGDSARH